MRWLRIPACPAAKHPETVALVLVVAVESSRLSVAVIVQPVTLAWRLYQTPVETPPLTVVVARPVQLLFWLPMNRLPPVSI